MQLLIFCAYPLVTNAQSILMGMNVVFVCPASFKNLPPTCTTYLLDLKSSCCVDL